MRVMIHYYRYQATIMAVAVEAGEMTERQERMDAEAKKEAERLALLQPPPPSAPASTHLAAGSSQNTDQQHSRLIKLKMALQPVTNLTPLMPHFIFLILFW